jgi:hypothetical protein
MFRVSEKCLSTVSKKHNLVEEGFTAEIQSDVNHFE